VNEAGLERGADGRVRLSGDLDFTTVPVIWPELESLLRDGSAIELSLAGVDHTNSAALAMLIEALAVAKRNGGRLVLADIPAELLDLARMSSCEELVGGAR